MKLEERKAKFVKQLSKEGYKLLSEYVNAHTYVVIECPKHHVYRTKPSKFVSGTRCRKCFVESNKKKGGQLEQKRIEAKTRFTKLVKSIGYTQLSEYHNSRSTITLQCDKQHVYNTTPNSFVSGSRCPTCFGLKDTKPKDRFLEKVREHKMIQLTEYVNNRKPVLLRCAHGHEFSIAPDYFKGCEICESKRDKYAKFFADYVNKSDYKILSNYINSRTKMDFECPNHHIFSLTPHSFRDGRRCPICCKTGYNKGSQGIIYLVRWTSTKTTKHHSILKFGITNNVHIEKRIKQQATKTDYVPSLVDARYFINGEVPVHLENQIKKSFKTGVIEKRFFGDGYTETVQDSRRNERLIKKLIWSADQTLDLIN